VTLHFPEDMNLQQHHCENLKSCTYEWVMKAANCNAVNVLHNTMAHFIVH